MSTTYTPKYIDRTIDYNPRDILTAQDFNEILNLIISQGNYNSHWLNDLYNLTVHDIVFYLWDETYGETQGAYQVIEAGGLTTTIKGTYYISKTVTLNAYATTDVVFNGGIDFTANNFLNIVTNKVGISPVNVAVEYNTCTVTLPIDPNESEIEVRIYQLN